MRVKRREAHQAQYLLRAEKLRVRGELHPLRRHAVEASQVAALRERDAQVVVPPPAHDRDTQEVSPRGDVRVYCSIRI